MAHATRRRQPTRAGSPGQAVGAQAAAATRSLYERHGQRVFTFCLNRLRDREEAQDAAQTTFLYVLKALDRGVVPRHERAWLLKIAGNVCHSSRRSGRRRRAITSAADPTELDLAAESLSAETRDDVRNLRVALARLPESQRRALLLREWQGLSNAEVADELQLSVPAVEALLFRGRRMVAAQLERARKKPRTLELGSAHPLLDPLLEGGTAAAFLAAEVVRPSWQTATRPRP